MKARKETETTVPTEESVVTRILTSFVDAVDAEDDLKEVAERLRETVVEKRELNEAALRTALFGRAL